MGIGLVFYSDLFCYLCTPKNKADSVMNNSRVNRFAGRIQSLQSADLCNMFHLTESDTCISFSGGLPAPELFPTETIGEAVQRVLSGHADKALQYTTTEGYAPLRQWIVERMNRRLGTSWQADNILVTNGSQQALDLAGKVFLDEGDVVLCETPTYLAALQAFRAYGCCFRGIPMDDEGMRMDVLEHVLQTTARVRLIYVIPVFQNPTGKTWSLERRRQLAELASRYDVMVVEDNPYEELRFSGEVLPSVRSFDTTGQVLCCGTFSKTLCPGFRLGWIAGEKDIIRNFVLAKQGMDLNSSAFVQYVVADWLAHNDFDTHVRRLCSVYKERRDVALSCIERFFPDDIRFTRPDGGLFTWIELPEELSARRLLPDALACDVAFMPGDGFYPEEPQYHTLRLNYSNRSPKDIEMGMQRLGILIQNALLTYTGR